MNFDEFVEKYNLLQDEEGEYFIIDEETGEKKEPYVLGIVLQKILRTTIRTIKSHGTRSCKGKGANKKISTFYNLNDLLFLRENKKPQKSKPISEYPILQKEYSEKNLIPASAVFAGTNKKLWWKCIKCGHEWLATGAHRSSGKTGCPACRNLIATEKNNLAITHPNLAAEYMSPPKNNLPANKIITGTNKKIWWKCSKCKHEWQAQGNSRKRGSGCPICSINSPLVTKKRNLAILHPELAKEYSQRNKTPSERVTAGSSKKYWWKCSKCDHEWQAVAFSRKRGSGCPSCANQVVTEKNNLAITHPILAAEYLPPPKNKLPANKIIASTSKKLWWKCSVCGYEWQTTGVKRIKGRGCLSCTNKIVTNKNNLTITHPILAAEYLPPPKNKLPANKIIAGTNKKLWWKCSICSHEWQATGNSRSSNTGCPICAIKKRIETKKTKKHKPVS